MAPHIGHNISVEIANNLLYYFNGGDKMRLREVFAICIDANNTWVDLSFEEKKGAGDIKYYVLKNIVDIKKCLEKLDRIKAFSVYIEAIRKTSIAFEQSKGTAYFDGSAKNSLNSAYNRLRDKILTIAEVSESIEYEHNNNGFDVKLPPNMSLSDLSKCAKDLDQIFSTCPLLKKHNSIISFSSVDVGSVWLTFLVTGSSVALILSMVAALIDKAIIIRSHQLTAKEAEEKVRSLALGNEMLETTKRIYNEMGAALLEKECKTLAEKNDISDPEDFERLKHSTKLLAEWMGKGMEIYASIQATPETKATFPPIETQSLPDKAISLLTDGSTPTNE